MKRDEVQVRKAVIPVAGLGTRFLPVTKAQPKEMLPVVDKPAIQYVVEEAVAAGITDILMITGRGKRSLEDHFDRSFELEHYLRAKGDDQQLAMVTAIAEMADIHYVRQKEPNGLGHAVGVARQHVGDEPFVVMLGDDLMAPGSTVLADMIAEQARLGGLVLAAMEVPREHISFYGCIDPEPGGADAGPVRVRGIVEKPDPSDAPSLLAVAGRYVLTPEIFDAIDEVKPGKGGEIQLTDAIALLLRSQPVHAHVFSGGRYDIGSKLDWLRATVELALEDDELGPGFATHLTEIVRRRGLT